MLSCNSNALAIPIHVPQRPRLTGILLVLLTSLLPTGMLSASDWPMYKKNIYRNSISDEELEFPLKPAWVYKCAQPPAPAWPDPLFKPTPVDFAYFMNLMSPVIIEFDYAPQPIVAGGMVFFNSTADDSVRAIDLRTGRPRWRFTTGGPVRFAPSFWQGKLYVASDDGVLYCLEAASGKVVWRRRMAPEDRRLSGNGRVISRWPLRSGVMVDKGVAYVTAGMWPAEGVFVFALDAATGKELWCNDTSNALNERAHSFGAYSITGIAPQGYLLATEDRLAVPNGRSVPAIFNRRTGKLSYFKQTGYQHRIGGPWATIDKRYGRLCFGSNGGRLHPSPRRGNFEFMYLKSGGVGAPTRLERVITLGRVNYVVFNGKVWRSKGRLGTGGKATKLAWSQPFPYGRAHSIALTANALLIGGQDSITAYDVDSGKELWHHAGFDGQVRGMAISGGNLLASTSNGRIYRLSPQAPAGPAVISPAPRSYTAPELSATARAVLAAARKARLTRGYALLLGKDTVQLAEQLAAKLELHFIAIVDSEQAVASERKRLIDSSTIYGARITVQHLANPTALPYADYLFNLIAVTGATEIPVAELSRALRPCGGVLWSPVIPMAPTTKLVNMKNEPQGELKAIAGMPAAMRGRLPGAFDWNSEIRMDRRVRWPLELLWFGEPGPARALQDGPVPRAANGRFFFVGRHRVMGIDAYNGTTLWERYVPYAHLTSSRQPLSAGLLFLRHKPGPLGTKGLVSSIYANDEHVYLHVGGLHYQLDAQTGKQLKVYGKFPAPKEFVLDEKPVFQAVQQEPIPTEDQTIAPEGASPAVVALENSGEALVLTMQTNLTKVEQTEYWEFFFDFRKPARRFNLYEPGIFHLVVRPAKQLLEYGLGDVQPSAQLTASDQNAGKKLTLTIPWDELEKVAGFRPRDFRFAFVFSHLEGKIFKRYARFAPNTSYVCSNGWARILIDREAGPAANPRGLVASLDELPKEMRAWSKVPPTQYRPKGYQLPPTRSGTPPRREQPLTGLRELRTYQRGKGCGGLISAASMDVMRSGNLGFYDFDDDSGMRYFGGVRASCRINMIPALGVLFAPEGSSNCTCSYNYRTSVALAPAARQKNEDWALYAGTNDAESFLKKLAINFGAPGDRRDRQRTLWMQFPRPPAPGSFFLDVPLRLTYHPKAERFRVNADRTTISNTDRPWIYASGHLGIKKAVLGLAFSDSARPTSFPASRPVKVDGALTEPCWDNVGPVTPGRRNGSVFMRHDRRNLYLAYSRKAPTDRRGKKRQWVAKTDGRDGPAWEDDALEIFLANPAGENLQCLHLVVSASGAKYDARWNMQTKLQPKGELDSALATSGEDARWNGKWIGAARTTADLLSIEVAIPWKMLQDAGLKRDGLMICLSRRGRLQGPATNVKRLIQSGKAFFPITYPDLGKGLGPYTVRLHFAELTDVGPGERVFSVKLQGETVLDDFDVVAEAGGRNVALVKEFKNIQVDKTITLEFLPKAAQLTARNMPIISGLEVLSQVSE